MHKITSIFLKIVHSQVEVPDRKSICPDRPRRKVSMSRPSQTESAYVQTFVRSKFFVRSSCVQNSLCPDFGSFKILYDQTLVRSFIHNYTMNTGTCLTNQSYFVSGWSDQSWIMSRTSSWVGFSSGFK